MTTRKTQHAEVRNTKQRRAVVRALQHLDDFISTQDLHRVLQEREESVSLATTYRILQSMAELGQVDVLRSSDGEAIYRRCEAEHHHHHLVCRSCGAAVELEAPQVESWAEQTARRYGYADVDHTVEISGICAECAAVAGPETGGGPEDQEASGPPAETGTAPSAVSATGTSGRQNETRANTSYAMHGSRTRGRNR
ncbi:MAG: transcriptional repressor [Kocuria rhizophila]|nr:transcriptional repressor [Kocuria rhizophila]